MPDIVKNYVQTGKVKIVFKDFAFLGNDSITAGEYARAVWKLSPTQYFAWRTAMYNAQDQEGDQGFGNAASIDKLTATISGIDAAAVAADVKANGAQYKALLDADKAEAAKLGVQATPSFIIGTKLLAGAYPYAQFDDAIKAALGK
jgi:protein-disulfide isomerase